MRSTWLVVLLSAFALASVTDAVQVVQRPLDAPAEAPLFANGKDVFGRSPRCRVCHALLNSLNSRMVPELLKIKAKEERRLGGGGADSRAVRYGLFEETIERYVQGACATQELWHSRETRKHCEGIMEAHEDELATAYTRWLKKGAPEETDGWSWNWEVCYKATQSCAEELAMHALSEFDDDGSGASERKYRSEPIPELGAKREGLYHLVAGAFYDAVVKDDTVDVLVYTAFPNADGGDFHRWILPGLVAVQELFDANPTAPGAFRVAMIDAELNDVPPPYGTGSKDPTLCLYPAGNKGWPRFISDVHEGQLTPHEILFFVMNTASAATSDRARKLMEAAPSEVTQAKAWEHDDL